MQDGITGYEEKEDEKQQILDFSQSPLLYVKQLK